MNGECASIITLFYVQKGKFFTNNKHTCSWRVTIL